MITIIGLGPAGIDRLAEPVKAMLASPDHTVVVRTLDHPAAAELAQSRTVISCDDIYESGQSFDQIYDSIVERVIGLAGSTPVLYAVPGSPMIGEFAVRRLLDSEVATQVVAGESFADALLAEIGYDPLDRGLQLLNGHELPDPLVLDKPTIVAHLDTPETLSDVLDAVSRVLPEGAPMTLARNVGSPDAELTTGRADELSATLAGQRTSLYVDAAPGGLIGAVQAMRLLRVECPWDREQTHQSLVKNLVEEAYELIDAIARLSEPEIDWVAYAAVEDELGDVLLQVLFHEAIARESGAFDIDGVAEVLRQKLVRRHPHVFGDVEVADSAEVKRNWDRIKGEEPGNGDTGSAMDGVPHHLPALHRAAKIQNRAAKVGFDWDTADEVVPKVVEELDELESARTGSGDVEAEVGDLIFSIINLARHLGVDPELALNRANREFERRFRIMEGEGPLDDLDLEGLNQRWERAKAGPGPSDRP